MSLNRWQLTVLDLFTEVGRLEPLIDARIDSSRPAGLNDIKFIILNHLCRVFSDGDTREGMGWTLDGLNVNLDENLNAMIADGLIQESVEGRVSVTALGQETHESAIRDLSPVFEQMLSDTDLESMESAMKTLREIRRTMENMPDR